MAVVDIKLFATAATPARSAAETPASYPARVAPAPARSVALGDGADSLGSSRSKGVRVQAVEGSSFGGGPP